MSRFDRGERVEVFVHDGHAESGPYSVQELWDRRRRGEIDDCCSYWYDGMAQWRPMSHFVPPEEQALAG